MGMTPRAPEQAKLEYSEQRIFDERIANAVVEFHRHCLGFRLPQILSRRIEKRVAHEFRDAKKELAQMEVDLAKEEKERLTQFLKDVDGDIANAFINKWCTTAQVLQDRMKKLCDGCKRDSMHEATCATAFCPNYLCNICRKKRPTFDNPSV